MIPTVYRDDYIVALQAFSNNRDAAPVIRMFTRAIQMTAEVPWEQSWDYVASWLALNSAFLEPHESKWGLPPPNNVAGNDVVSEVGQHVLPLNR